MSVSLDEAALANIDWTRLTRNHRSALDILVGSKSPIQAQEPRAFRRALHDLWGLRLAERKVTTDGLFYEATFLGRRVHARLDAEAGQ